MIYFLVGVLFLVILLVAIVAAFSPITTEEKIEYLKSLEKYKKKNDYSKFDF